ncbi:hypothetical protein [Trujillonella humicola]|uniref:hypothetical protein n=1 Tax=Trujillonella humicola TaxID=3383699 RepID=UPI003905A6D6
MPDDVRNEPNGGVPEAADATDFWARVQRRVEASGVDLPPEEIIRLRDLDRR